MKNKDKKMMLFVIATIVTSLGIGYTLLRGTRATTELPPNEAFADINFYKCVVDAYNSKNTTEYDYTTYSLTDEELQSISSLMCRSSDINDVKGIEKLTNLTNLDLNSNNIKNIDLTELVNLTKLSLAYNNLESINLSNNVLLTYLDLRDNKIDSIDISKNVSLVTLELGTNYLNELDVSYNNELTNLNITDNMISEIDLSNNLVLENLDIGKTKISEIDLSNNKELRQFQKWNNCNTSDNGYQTVGGDCSYYEELVELDISQNENLETLILGYNNLGSINLDNNINLKKLKLYDCKITSLDLSHNVNLESLELYDDYKTIDISKNINLKSLNLQYNEIETLDISKNVNLEALSMHNNMLKTLDTSNNSKLWLLNLGSNNITTIDVSNNVMLTSLYLNNNKLKTIDLSKNINLKSLGLSYNSLTAIDVGNNSLLTDLRINNNPFSETVYAYKNTDVSLGENILYPDSLGWTSPTLTSDNEAIVQIIDNGKIKPLVIGSAIITSALEDKYTNTSTVNVVEITSNKYDINDLENYIYVGTENDSNTILENINYPENIDLDVDLENNKLKVMYQDNILKEFTILRLHSDKYNLDNSYIYSGIDKFSEADIETNANILVENDKLSIKYNENVLKTFDLISISSEKYFVKDKFIYISTSQLNIDDIIVPHCEKKIIDNTIQLVYEDVTLDQFSILSLTINELRKFGNLIFVIDSVSYDTFVSYLVVSEGMTYKLIDTNGNEVTDGTILDGTALKVYYGDCLLDDYIITDDYVKFNQEVSVNEENLTLYNLKEGTTISQILSLIDTNGNISVYDKENTLISDNTGKLKTGDKFKISFDEFSVVYMASVAGDVDGDGDIGPADLKKVSEYLLDNSIISEEVYLMASDYDGNGSININDVIKMTDYYIDNLNNG